jgi:hypothetical protein
VARCDHVRRAALAFTIASGAFYSLAGCERSVHAADPCQLDEAHPIAEAHALAFDAIDVVHSDGTLMAAWSVPEGLFTRPLAADGRGLSQPTFVAERCRGGLSLSARPGGAWLACSRPDEHEDESAVVLYALDASGRASDALTLGAPGRDGKGVVVETRGEQALVAWHDGHVGAYGVRLSRIEHAKVRTELLSRPAVPSHEPDLRVSDGRFTVVFAETRFSSLTKSQTRIMAVREGEDARAIRDVNVPDPAPALAHDGRSLILTFRSLPPRETKPELYAMRLDDELRSIGEPRQIGRANSDGAPSTLACAGQGFALLPREYATERYIAVHALDAALENQSSGHQFYATDRDFVLSRGTCLGGRALIVAAERAKVSDPRVHMVGMTFACKH